MLAANTGFATPVACPILDRIADTDGKIGTTRCEVEARLRRPATDLAGLMPVKALLNVVIRKWFVLF